MNNIEAIDVLRKVAMKTAIDCTDIKEPKSFMKQSTLLSRHWKKSGNK